MNIERTCRNLIVPVVLLLVLEFASSLASGAVMLVYDSTDGNVTLDTSELAMVSFSLENAQGQPFFISENADFSELPPPLFPPDVSSTQIGWIAQDLSTGFVGVANLGNIFPTGMTQSEVEAFTNISGTEEPKGRAYALGPVPPGGGGQMTVAVVPEPATQLLLALGGLFGMLSMARSR